MSWIDEKAWNGLSVVRKGREEQLYPHFRPYESGGIHAKLYGKPVVNFSSNDYLGLTMHPKVREAAKLAVERYACGLSSSRVQATTVAHI
jgi:7-keto-8-aminopelargonate synthetase-like enzyme